jgi:hypothetical protein
MSIKSIEKTISVHLKNSFTKIQNCQENLTSTKQYVITFNTEYTGLVEQWIPRET